jgi:hypothetical protein
LVRMRATRRIIIIPLDLGGAGGDANLWAQPRRSIEPVWNAEAKDRLEGNLGTPCAAGRSALQRRKEKSGAIGIAGAGGLPE